MKNYLTLTFLSLIIFLTACSSGKQAFEKGNYYEASMKAIKRLRNNPKNSNAQDALADAYPLAVEYHTGRAQTEMRSNDPFKWEKVLDNYNKINRLYDEIQRAPAALKIISNPQDYTQQINDARNKGAAARYDAGLVSLNRKTREDAKKAFFHFEKANELVPNYQDVQNKLDAALFEATLKVVVEHVPIPAGQFAFSYDFFYNEVFEFLKEYKRNDFVRFYSPEEAKQGLPYIDQVLRFRFDDFVVGQTHTNSETIHLKDSVDKKVTLNDGTKETVKDEVNATYTQFRRTVVSSGLLNLEIVDANSKTILSQEKLPGEFVWQSEWATYKGDKRALSKKQVEMSELVEVPPPPPQQLFVEFCRPIYDQIRSKVRHFYRRY